MLLFTDLEALPAAAAFPEVVVALPLAALVVVPEVVAVLAALVVLERVTAWEAFTLSRISRALAALFCPGLKLSLAGMSALRTENERSGCETP